MSVVSRLPRVLCAAILFAAAVLHAGAAAALSWTSLNGPFGGQPDALAVDAAGNTWAGMNSAGVFYRPAGSATWVAKAGAPTMGVYEIVIDAAGTPTISGSAGIYTYAAAGDAWSQLAGSNGLPGGAGGGLVFDAQGALYAGMNSGGVYKRAAGASAWTALGTGLPAGEQVGTLVVDGAGNLWAALYGIGVYKLAAGSTTWTAVNTGLTKKDINAMTVVGNDLFVALQFGGVAKLTGAATGGTTWAAWVGGAMPADAGVYAFARGPGNTLYVGGYGTVYALASGANTWTKAGTGIETYTSTYSIAYSQAANALLLGNQGGVWTMAPGGATWTLSVEGMAASTIYGLVSTAGGDLYAATFGQGVQRLAAGATTWTAVDPQRMGSTATTIAVDGNGMIYATTGGNPKRLSGGQWTDPGPDVGGFASVVAVDAANALWVGVDGKVRKLAAGAWVDVGAGLPSETIDVLVPGPNGAAWAAMWNVGLYQLSANGTTWNAIDAGLPDKRFKALVRDSGGALLAGIAGGVYRYSGGTWQAVGTNLSSLGVVLALAFDANGDLYAGTEQSRVWRLAAGATKWEAAGLGLGSRRPYVLLAAGGNLYAGMDSSGGAPSGVFRLQRLPAVVEFHNTNLDHYFITADPAEQAAVAGGAAGPGWEATGGFFVAGGPNQVCRFYGSVSPGPNSHFYTIDPAECQQLKDLAAVTPATQKRWNFESNDFASSRPVQGQCAAGTVPVYRAYNNGFSKGVDSNHRITTSFAAYQAQVAAGWSGEGVVMCAPQ